MLTVGRYTFTFYPIFILERNENLVLFSSFYSSPHFKVYFFEVFLIYRTSFVHLSREKRRVVSKMFDSDEIINFRLGLITTCTFTLYHAIILSYLLFYTFLRNL